MQVRLHKVELQIQNNLKRCKDFAIDRRALANQR